MKPILQFIVAALIAVIAFGIGAAYGGAGSRPTGCPTPDVVGTAWPMPGQ